MDYRVETSGRILLPEYREVQLLSTFREELANRPGRLDDPSTALSLEDFARAVGVRAVRDGEWVLLVTDREGDIRWTEQTSTFYAALAVAATDGEVRLSGEDGTTWSYHYSPTGLVQDGVNGFDGSRSPLVLTPSAGTPEQQEESRTRPTHADPEPTASSPPPFTQTDLRASLDSDTPAYPPPPEGWPPAPESGHIGDAAPEPRSPGRAFAMAALFLGGVFLILVIAMMAAGIA